MIINNIISIMKSKKITAYKLEKDTGIRQQSFNNWKNGTSMSIDSLQKIIKYLGVTPNEVFGYPNTELTENEQELLELFQQLPEREQIKFIGRLEDTVEKFKEN